ncbi:carboxymuconolactone decarboxylase family protein [Rugamonas sp.]|uniref:carboxymuconolactone decarboxylase family protein n=1 Tax=Rugamonas sp. TaxID=1926287 RepID=UPI0025F897D4|nr:carboxymuconolactone decarboxylase family protein [Rugamonas sp.]
MKNRIDYHQASPEAIKALIALELAVQRSGLDLRMLQLVKMRASQINGCAFCVDMESAEAMRAGESFRRLAAVAQWRDSALFSGPERATLAWTEALTELGAPAARDSAMSAMSRHFDARQIGDWTLAVAAINCWNRMGVGFRKAIL